MLNYKTIKNCNGFRAQESGAAQVMGFEPNCKNCMYFSSRNCLRDKLSQGRNEMFS